MTSYVSIKMGEFELRTEPTPDNRDGWDRVIVEHLPTKYRKMDAGYERKTADQYEELLTQVVMNVAQISPRDNLVTWPEDVQKRFPVMMEREQRVYDGAVLALHELDF